MSRLNFAPISEAFYLGSDQIKDTRSEIENLRKVIGDSELVKKPQQQPKQQVSQVQQTSRIGNSDKVVANFNNQENNNLDMLKIVQHPRFNDIVKNYIIVNKPEWIKNPELANTQFIPNRKESFSPSSAQQSNQQNFTYFLIFGLIVYLFLEKMLKE
jgi:hypothetical protein